MTEPTWHLERAKVLLENWYLKVDRLREYARLAVSIYPTRINKKAACDYNRTALHCKTAGLVWHDRFKMILDCNRGNVLCKD